MLMGIAAYAAHRGSTLNAVQHAIADGRITLNADNLIDADAADRQWEESVDFAKKREGPLEINRRGPGGSPDEPAALKHPTEPVPGMSYTQARALREVYDAQRRKLELQLRHGEMVAVRDVEAAAFKLYRQLRDACFNIAPRLAGQLTGQTDEQTIFDLIDAEVRHVFDSFAQEKAA